MDVKFMPGQKVIWNWYPPGDCNPVRRDAVFQSVVNGRANLRYNSQVYSVRFENIESVDLSMMQAVSHTEFGMSLPTVLVGRLAKMASACGVGLNEFLVLAVFEGSESVVRKFTDSGILVLPGE